MKFFDLELGGLAAANIKYTKSASGGKGCAIVIYTNGTTSISCGENSKPGKKVKDYLSSDITACEKYPSGKPLN